MDIIISNAVDQPIYEQIFNQMKQQIIGGKLSEGDILPSIRTLAKDLKISVITTKRAYDELEKEGFIYTVAGKGCFVAEKNLELVREGNLSELEDLLRRVDALAVGLNISDSELMEMLHLLRSEN
ncbi:MAG TPA: GntR family transcriptional regulator [Candidatus Avidehalobacter gallistercoris]|uniref:GntR family transcriptional regulator n=1 Tax=Candidatus Avidehalobacter gallistercoris TaxID=2840694 RepID=A0A9D1HKW3_9FIRM|nr:GntR family transcriptional regulator [Candidatus Avidehalobacter gallistercoris]